MELALPSQVMITAVYWIALHREVVKQMKIEKNDDPIVYFIFVAIHIWPFFSICVHVYISHIKFIKSHSYFMIVLAISYLTVNFLGTKIRNEAIYPFLDWKDYKSPLIGGILTSIGYYSFESFCNLVNSFGKRY